MPNTLEVSDDIAGTEVDLYLSIRSIGVLMQSILLLIEITGDQELFEIYETLYSVIEPYGSVKELSDED
jgi:hypothetical protein